MLTLYAVCLIIGGALVALAIFGGGDFDVDADVADLDVDAPAEVETGVDAEAAGEGVAAAARFLSLRNAVFFAAFFGLTGTLFTMLRVGSVLTAVLALLVGGVAAATVFHLMEYLRGSEAGVLADADILTGAAAEVVIDVAETRPGKIAVKSGDRTLQFVARPHDEAETRRFRSGDEVVIVRVAGGVAEIAGTRFLA